MACLDDNEASEFVSGSLPGAAFARAEAHLAGCRDCRALVAGLAAADDDDDDDAADSRLSTRRRAPALGKRGRRGPALAEATTSQAAGGRGGAAADPGWMHRSLDPVVVSGDRVGRYLVLSRLGAGGMGVVFTAFDPKLNRKVALKLIRTRSGVTDAEARSRLVREAQAIAQLAHPNVVAVYDVGTAETGEVYLAMELVEGETLRSWLGQWDRTWREILEVFGQAGRGLMAAHAQGLVHRDFKPDNVLVGVDGRVRVTDFGLARSLLDQVEQHGLPLPDTVASPLQQVLTDPGTVLGTPRYMAPEQRRGTDADARSDQFSFCVALYEALYHRHPLPGDSVGDALTEGTPAAPPPDGTRVPAAVGRAIMRGLALEPAGRFTTMAGLLAAITPPPAAAPRRWGAALAIGLTLAVALGGVAVATLSRARGDDELARLQRELRDTVAQRDALVRRLDALLAEARDRQVQADEVRRLRAQLEEKDQQIQQLETELGLAPPTAPDAAAAVAVADRRPPRDAAPPAVPGLPEAVLQASLAERTAAVESCLREYAERADVEAFAVVVDLEIAPGGAVQRHAHRGLDDTITPACVGRGLARSRFPAADVVTLAEVTAAFDRGAVRLTARRTGTTTPVPELDL